MSFSDLGITERYRFGWTVLVALGGTLCGLFILLLTILPPRWATLGILGTMVPFVALVTGNVKRFFLAMLVFTLPIQLDITIRHSGHLGGAAGFIISLYDITLAVLYILWISEIVRNKNEKINFFPRISLPFFCLIGMATLSMVNAFFPELSLFEIVQMLKMYLGFLYVANNIKSRKEIQFVVALLLLGLFLESILGLAQYKFDRPLVPSILGGPEKIGYIRLGEPLSRISGTWASYNDFAWYLTFMLPISMSLLFSRTKGIYKSMCGLTLVVGIGALICTLSRAGWYSFGVATLIVLLLNFAKTKGKTELSNFATSIVAILIVISVIATVNPQFLNIVNRRVLSDDYDSAYSRIPQMQVASNIIRANPLLGIGINNYTEVMDQYDTTDVKLTSITRHQVHNIFLQVAAEMGIAGLAIFIWLIFMVYKKGLSYFKESEGSMSAIVIGLIAGITAFLIHGLVDAASLGNHLFLIFWFFAGMVIAIKKLTSQVKPFVVGA
ncbi:O-antigen ligase family protein [bacterium]|nr:O-antigen ligase family protein [bacterium]